MRVLIKVKCPYCKRYSDLEGVSFEKRDIFYCSRCGIKLKVLCLDPFEMETA